MVNNSNSLHAVTDQTANGSHPENQFCDPKIQFEAWMEEVRPVAPLQIDHAPPDFIVECEFGSNCEIQFAGVLQLEGFLNGAIRSSGGTLITGPGIIDAQIEVGTAIIGSFGEVNVTATERVLLRGHVSVSGYIRAPALSIREGAIFDGDCTFLESLVQDPGTRHLQVSEASPVVIAASGVAD